MAGFGPFGLKSAHRIMPGTEELRSVTAVVENLPTKTKAASSNIGKGSGGTGDDVIEGPTQTEMTFSIDEFSCAIMAKIVKKCGSRDNWEDWSASIAKIAKNHNTRLTGLLKDSDTDARHAYDAFLAELRDNLNDTISEGDAIEMLAQHLITRPVIIAVTTLWAPAPCRPSGSGVARLPGRFAWRLRTMLWVSVS
jgi:predicted helicase